MAVSSATQISELSPPTVVVYQEFETETVTPLLPTLAPVIVGACKEIHELRDSSGSLNSDILLSGPAIATADNSESSYTSMDSLTLKVSVNDGAVQTFTMPSGATTMTAQEVATQINGSTPAPVGFGAYVYEDASSNKYLQLKTTASGSSKAIKFVGGSSLSKFGWGVHRTYYGLGAYSQDAFVISQSAFPNPHSIADGERDIIEDQIRGFVNLGSSVTEMLRTQSFLRRDSYDIGGNYGVEAYDDGDGDSTTPLVDVVDSTGTAENFSGGATSAVVTGITDIQTSPVYLHGETLTLQVDGERPQTVTFYGQPIISSDSTGWTFLDIQSDSLEIEVNGVTVTVSFSAGVSTIGGVVDEINAQTLTDVGVNVAYRSGQYGDLDATGNYMSLFYGADPSSIVRNTEIVVPVQAHVGAAEFFSGIAADPETQNLQANNPDPSCPVDSTLDQINNLFSSTIATINASSYLVLTSTSKGTESKIEIGDDSSAVGTPQPTPTTLLGLDVGADGYIYYGNPFALRSGDALYGDGSLLGHVVEVQPGAVTGRIRLDTEVATTGTWTSWYIIAKTLDAHDPSTEWGVTVPTPDLYLDDNNRVHVKHDFARDTSGAPIVSLSSSFYLMFDSLRKDVTVSASDPGLVSYYDQTTLESELGPISPDNPLSYGIWLAMQAAPTVTIYGLGVDAISSDRPYGTLQGFTDALDYLESQDAYAVALLSTQDDIPGIAKSHAIAMSDPSVGQTRVCIVHTDRPSRKEDTIVSSGNDGNSVGGTGTFDTGIATLSQDLLAEGIDPASITVSDDVYLDFSSDNSNWNVTGSVTDGTKLVINTTFTGTENSDGFYDETSAPTSLVSESFSLKIRGASVSDKNDEVVSLYNKASSLGSRRVWMQFCDELRASVNGVEQNIEGFFSTAVKAGLVAGLKAGTPMSKYGMPVFLNATGTKGVYRKDQLNKIASGGVDIVWRPEVGASVQSRHQLTTDTSTIEKQEQSITVAIDFVERFYRQNLSPYSGRYNITENMLASISSIIAGLSELLTDTYKVVDKVSASTLTQSESNPTKMALTVQVTPFYPGNTIEITIVV